MGVGEAVVAAAVGSAVKEVVAPFVKKFVDGYVSRIVALNGAKRAVASALKNYPAALERRTKFVPTIAIQGSLFELEAVYEPVTLRDATSGSEVSVSKFPVRLIPPSQRLLVVDSAGMGKSTFSKYVARCAIKEERFFPVIVELRKIRPDQSLATFICEELVGVGGTPALQSEIEKAFAAGGFLFLLDGLDEVEEHARPRVNQEIVDFCVKFELCPVVLTSRPDRGLSSFHGFRSCSIRPLELVQAYSLLRRYDHGRGKADPLIEKVKLLKEIHQLLENPLMVTLLYRAYDYKATIPLKRGIFFRQVFEALYQDHDLSKEGGYERRKKSDLDLDDFQRFLRAFGIVTYSAGRVQYDSGSFDSHLRKASEVFESPKVGLQDVSRDLLSAVPVLMKDGTDVRWSHKAFQDYFAADFLVRDLIADKACKYIRQLLGGPNPGQHENLLSLVAEADIGLIRTARLNDLFLTLTAEVERHNIVTEVDFALFSYEKIAEVYLFQIDRVTGSRRGGKNRTDPMTAVHDFLTDKLRYGDGLRAASTFTFLDDGIGVLAVHREEWELWRTLSVIDPVAFRSCPLTAKDPDFGLLRRVLEEFSDTGGFVSVKSILGSSRGPDLRIDIARCLRAIFPGAVPSLSSMQKALTEMDNKSRERAVSELLFGR